MSFSHTGFAAGSHFTHAGSGANFLCMAKDPIFRPNGVSGGGRGYLYGVEYQNPILPAVQEYDVPCAVCKAPRCAVFMLPGRDECYNGWITEYAGWLASSYHGSDRNRNEYICVDREAQNEGSSVNQDGALIYPVQTKCGSLPCSTYPDGHDMRCAVCSQ